MTLPTPPTLPYTYKAMPSALPPQSYLTYQPPPSSANPHPAPQPVPTDPATGKPRFVSSTPSGGDGSQAQPLFVHPDEVIATCQQLREHVERLTRDAQREIEEFDERIRARDLAEKRRVAPGWLDSEVHILQPERAHQSTPPVGESSASGGGGGTGRPGQEDESRGEVSDAATDLGRQLDMAFSDLRIAK